MADVAHAWTDDEIAKLEKRLKTIYGKAYRELAKKQKDYLKEYDKQLKAMRAAVKAGTKTQAELDAWLENQAITIAYHSGMVEHASEDLANVTQRAADMANGTLPAIFAENANYSTFAIESTIKLSTAYSIYDEDTVKRLVVDKPDLLPSIEPSKIKGKAWSKAKMTAALTQGIMQGESIPNLAARLRETVGMEQAASIRAARTACTGAQNAGRVESYKRAQGLGIKLQQEWLATLDSRTRDSHRLADGQRVDVGEKFSVGSDKLDFPGDPHGSFAEVCNCRCTLVAAVEGVDQSTAERWSKLPEGQTYEQWKHEHEVQKPAQQPTQPAQAPKPAADVEAIRRRVIDLEREVNDAASDRVLLDEPNREYVDELERLANKYKAEMDKNAWAMSYTAEELDRMDDDLMRRFEDAYKVYNTRGLSSDELGRANALIDSLYEEQDKIEAARNAIRDYKRAESSYNDFMRMYNEALADADEKRVAYEAARKKLDDAIKARNRAYGELSDALPFAPKVRDTIGDEYADGMLRYVEAAEEKHPAFARLFRRFSSQFAIEDGNANGRGAYYNPVSRGIVINAARTAEKDVCHLPYQTFFHEFGHLIDNFSSYKYRYTSSDGLHDVIKSDWNDFVRQEAKKAGVRSQKKQYVIQLLKDEMTDTEDGIYAYGSVSDIIEGCIGIPWPFGVGHGVGYWSENNNSMLEKEFFAEVCDGAMANEASYQQMKRIFPNAVAMVERMVEEICS